MGLKRTQTNLTLFSRSQTTPTGEENVREKKTTDRSFCFFCCFCCSLAPQIHSSLGAFFHHFSVAFCSSTKEKKPPSFVWWYGELNGMIEWRIDEQENPRSFHWHNQREKAAEWDRSRKRGIEREKKPERWREKRSLKKKKNCCRVRNWLNTFNWPFIAIFQLNVATFVIVVAFLCNEREKSDFLSHDWSIWRLFPQKFTWSISFRFVSFVRRWNEPNRERVEKHTHQPHIPRSFEYSYIERLYFVERFCRRGSTKRVAARFQLNYLVG